MTSRPASAPPTPPSLPALAAELAKLGLSESPPTPEVWAAAWAKLTGSTPTPVTPDVSADDADHDLNLLEATADAVIIFAPDGERILAANAHAGARKAY
jgi:hypothetical protein